MKKFRKRLKTYYYKHWNCLPWFICGLMILIRGDISRFNYGSMWIALLIMMWFFCPTEDINKLSETESKGDDDMLVLPIKKKWYDMILAGEKTEEYREIKSYYDSRFESVFGCQWLFRGIDGIGNMTPPEKELYSGTDIPEAPDRRKRPAHLQKEPATRNGEQSRALNIMCCTSRKYRR